MKKLFVALLLLPTLLLVACEPMEQPKKDVEVTQAPTPSVAATQSAAADDFPTPGEQAPAPAADPGPHNDPNAIQLKVWWRAEVKEAGTLRWGHNLQSGTINCPQPTQKYAPSDKKYYGVCTHNIMGVGKGDTVSLEWKPANSYMWAMCLMYRNARIAAGPQTVTHGRCNVEIQSVI